jgi:hypothetical protein
VDAVSGSPVLPTPEGVEAMERWKDGQRCCFCSITLTKACDVALSQPLTDLLTDQVTERQVTLEPKAVMILREA